MDSEKYLEKSRYVQKNFGDNQAIVIEGTATRGEWKGHKEITIYHGGAESGDSDGHGHFVATEIDGLFQVTLDRHPDAVDGGRHEIEASHNRDSYNNEARLTRLHEKEAVIEQIYHLDVGSPQFEADLQALKNKFYNIGSCGSYDNNSLRRRLEQAESKLTRKLETFRHTWARKAQIIQEAEGLLYDTDLRNAGARMKELFDEWKQLPRTTRGKDDELWKRFQDAKTRLREKQNAEYEQRKARQEAARSQKMAIVIRAESVACASDLKSAREEMKALMERWKAAPRASKEDEEQLWSRFQRARDALYARSKQEHEKRQQNYACAKTKKEALISRVEALCGTSDFRSAANEIQALSQQFYEAGSAGAENQPLKERFQAAKQRFYEAKRAAGQAKHDEYVRRMQEALVRKEGQLARLEDSIHRTEQFLSDLMSRPEPGFNNPHRYEIAARRNDKIAATQDKLRSMGERRQQLISQIIDMRSRAQL